MYLTTYNMKEMPFSITPDTSFFFNYDCYEEALNVLMVALRSGEGFIKITGEVGTGKTLLCRKLLNTLGDDFVTAYIPNPYLTPTALYVALADELKVPVVRNMGQHRLLKAISHQLIKYIAEGKRIVLCLDEAQAMPEETLEALRLLTNLETEKSKLLQVVIFGQPELDEKLARPSIRQLKQRITFSYQLQPMDKSGVAAYINHRLVVAGYNGRPLFPSAVVKELHRKSRGIPRLINILCHKALMVAYGQGYHSVNARHLRSAANDTEDVTRPSNQGWYALASMLVFGAALAAGYVLSRYQDLSALRGLIP